jgi:hypothetical protein
LKKTFKDENEVFFREYVNLHDCRLAVAFAQFFLRSKKVQKTPKKSKKTAGGATHGQDARATVFSGKRFFLKSAHLRALTRTIKYLRGKSARKRAGSGAMNGTDGTKMTERSACGWSTVLLWPFFFIALGFITKHLRGKTYGNVLVASRWW